MINTSTFSLPVKIILALFICNLPWPLWGVYKMDLQIVSIILLVVMIGTLSFLLGYMVGCNKTWNQARDILQDSAKILEEHLWTIGKQ